MKIAKVIFAFFVMALVVMIFSMCFCNKEAQSEEIFTDNKKEADHPQPSHKIGDMWMYDWSPIKTYYSEAKMIIIIPREKCAIVTIEDGKIDTIMKRRADTTAYKMADGWLRILLQYNDKGEIVYLEAEVEDFQDKNPEGMMFMDSIPIGEFDTFTIDTFPIYPFPPFMVPDTIMDSFPLPKTW